MSSLVSVDERRTGLKGIYDLNGYRGSEKAAPRIDRLLRSLVGVMDLRLTWGPRGDLAGVHILRDDDVQEHQLVRNVVSGLRAGFGVELDPGQVHLHDDADAFGAVADAKTAAPAAVQTDGNGNHAQADAHANGHAQANGKAAAGGGGRGQLVDNESDKSSYRTLF